MSLQIVAPHACARGEVNRVNNLSLKMQLFRAHSAQRTPLKVTTLTQTRLSARHMFVCTCVNSLPAAIYEEI